MFAGGCGGLAYSVQVDPALVRGCYAGLTLFTAGFPGVLLYIVLMFIMPNAD